MLDRSRTPKTLRGVVRPQRVKCGKPTCRCASGRQLDFHGPYYYRFWRENGRLRKAYVPVDKLDSVRAACRLRQADELAFRSARDRARSHLSEIREQLVALRPEPSPSR